MSFIKWAIGKLHMNWSWVLDSVYDIVYNVKWNHLPLQIEKSSNPPHIFIFLQWQWLNSSGATHSKTCLKQPLKDQKLVFKTDYRLMQVKVLQNEHSGILLACIKLTSVFKAFVLSIF